MLSGLMAVIAVIYPVCALFSKQANDALFWLLVVLSIGVVFCRKNEPLPFSRLLKDYWPLWIAMSLFFLAELSTQLFATRLRLSLLFSEPFRFVLLPLLVYGWLSLPLERLKWARWGWFFCAIAGGVFLFVISGMGEVRPEPFNYTGMFLIPFTNFSVLMGAMVVSSIGWDNPKKKRSIVLGTLALCAVMCGLYASQTRASWIIALVFLVLASLFFQKGKKKKLLLPAALFSF
ncbi:MAG: hypothetical protein NC112_06115 [Oxalobacter formigenes]|nr:hypothetical protein [Oxalobacter formigenes]